MSGPLVVPWRPCGILPSGAAVLRPIVRVELAAPTGRTVETGALIDSGSDWSIAHVGLLDRLGLEPGDCYHQFDTVNGERESLSYLHPVTLMVAEVFKVRFAALRFRDWGMLASQPDNATMVLGSNDFCRFVKVTLDGDTTTMESRDGGTVWDMPPHDLQAA